MKAPITRLYFWFQGVSENRGGGPWWYRDDPPLDYLDGIKDRLYAYVRTDGSEPVNASNIRPPPTAQIVYPNGK